MVDLIAGTSTGGIIACGLAKPDPLSARRDRGDLRAGRAEDLRPLGAEGHHVGQRLPGRALRLGRPRRLAAPPPRRRAAHRRHHARPADRLRPRGAPGAAPALRATQHGRRRARHLGGADLLRARPARRPHAHRRRRVRDQPGRVRVRRGGRRSCCSRWARARTRAGCPTTTSRTGAGWSGPSRSSTSSSTAPPTPSTPSSRRSPATATCGCQTRLDEASDDLDDASEENLAALRREAERLIAARDADIERALRDPGS